MKPFQPSDPKAPPPDLNLPVFMGPLTLPQMPQPKRKRRWKLFLLWSVLMFVGGAAAGVALINEVCAAFDSVTSTLGLPVPRFVADRRLAAHAPLPTAVAPTPAPEPVLAPELPPAAAVPSAPAGTGVGQAVAAKPAAMPAQAQPEAQPEAEQAAEAPAPREPKTGHRPVPAAPVRAETAPEPEPPVARAPHGKGAGKTAPSASPSGKKVAKFDDPFASDNETAPAAKPAAASGKAKPAPSEPVAAAKSEPAPKPSAARSHDPLDNLMDDGVAASKGKKRDSKDLDALLKDVQKSEPAPKAKPEAPPPASALSPSDISRVMAGVTPRSNDCARRLNQNGNAELKITVGKDGRVSDANVGGNLAGTPLGACIEKATRAATFPASSGLRFDYRIDAR